MDYRNFHKTNRPFDKLRKKRTGSRFDAIDAYATKIDLPAIAGVVEAGRRTNRKAGETNEARIEEAAERLDARARSVAANESYGGPKFNAATFAKENNIDMNLRFDRRYERPDQIVANPPRRVTPPKPKPKPSAAEILYPNETGRRGMTPTQPAAPRAANKPGGARKLSPAEILYPNDSGPRNAKPAPVGTVTEKTASPGIPTATPTRSTASDTGMRNLSPRTAPLPDAPTEPLPEPPKAPEVNSQMRLDQVLRNMLVRIVLAESGNSPTSSIASPLASQSAAQFMASIIGAGQLSPNQEPQPVGHVPEAPAEPPGNNPVDILLGIVEKLIEEGWLPDERGADQGGTSAGGGGTGVPGTTSGKGQ